MDIKAESQPHQAHERECSTKFNGLDGEYGKSASLWLADMGRHRETGSSPSMFLQSIAHHLEGKAAQWILQTPGVIALVHKGYMELATESDIEAFCGAFAQRFKLTDKEAQDIFEVSPLDRLYDLVQGPNEHLEEYYNRARLLLNELHGDDGDNGTLTPSETSLHAVVVHGFTRGLSSKELYYRLLLQHIYHHTVSLYEAFKMAELEAKIMDQEKEREESREEGKDKKRKLAKDDKAAENAKKQKQAVVNT
ncbi:hypothetical protein IMSHALPRED_005283 [Imshaugia aleurites]|uniref:Uncharacterized protein n=1 Tax=Imshaugia aleurites TaxID=172621 RepID=A0A8H3INR3_9LECA|nr:hypothetical protein IMSHALPRED_005283 [Imshaugia aleurites]